MSINCASCKQRKKEENFSAKSLASEAPTCSTCNVRSIMARIEHSRMQVDSVRKQQKAVIEVTTAIEKNAGTKAKTATSHSLLKSILSPQRSA